MVRKKHQKPPKRGAGNLGLGIWHPGVQALCGIFQDETELVRGRDTTTLPANPRAHTAAGEQTVTPSEGVMPPKSQSLCCFASFRKLN